MEPATRSERRRADASVSRSVLVCLLVSLIVHVLGVAWISSAWAGGNAAATRGDNESAEDERTPEADEFRLGIASSERATINWLGFADPTPHRAVESDVEQAALVMSAPGAPVAPSSPRPDGAGQPSSAAASASRTASAETSSVDPSLVGEAVDDPAPVESASEPAAVDVDIDADIVVPETDAAVRDMASADEIDEQPVDPERAPVEDAGEKNDADVVTDMAETAKPAETERVADEQVEAEQVVNETDTEPEETADGASPGEGDSEAEESDQRDEPGSRPAPPGEDAGADTMAGIISDRESSPTSKPVDMSISDWGKPAAGEGVKVNPVRPRFPDTLAAFRRGLTATVLIDFGADGYVRDVRFEEVVIDRRRVVRNTGSPEADRVLRNSVFNWTATGTQIEELAERSEDAVVTVRMDMKIKP